MFGTLDHPADGRLDQADALGANIRLRVDSIFLEDSDERITARHEVDRDGRCRNRDRRAQQDVGETAGGGADVERIASFDIEVQLVERVRELLTSAGGVSRRALDDELLSPTSGGGPIYVSTAEAARKAPASQMYSGNFTLGATPLLERWLRANGMGTMAMLWPIVNANEQVFKNTQEDVLPAMKGDAFVCMCINANDPLRDMWGFLEQIKSIGVMSVSNIGPSVSYIDRDSEIFKVLRKCGITIENGKALGRDFSLTDLKHPL